MQKASLSIISYTVIQLQAKLSGQKCSQDVWCVPYFRTKASGYISNGKICIYEHDQSGGYLMLYINRRIFYLDL